MSDARRRAEEALAAYDACKGYECDIYAMECVPALRAFLAEPAPACGSVSTVRSDDPPAAPLPTCANCGSNLIEPAPADATEHPCGCYAPDGDHCHRHPAPPAASDEVREAAEAFRVASAAARDCRRAHVTYRYEMICDEIDERDRAAVALAETVLAALSRPAAKGGDE